MKHLRLLITDVCGKGCEGCCNNDWDLKALPIVKLEEYVNYDIVMLTGGEPFYYPRRIEIINDEIKRNNRYAKVYVYTAYLNNINNIFRTLNGYIDGLTISLHNQSDLEYFDSFITREGEVALSKSIRINIFKGVDYSSIQIPSRFIVKDNIEWIKNCPLPPDEVFMRHLLSL